MPPKRSGGISAARQNADALAMRCAILPVRMRGVGGLAWARHEFESLLAHLHGGILIRSAGKGDVMANLWLVRAAHEFAAAVDASPDLATDQKQAHLEFAGKKLLPVCKRVVQEFISEKGMDGVWMDDSGILSGLARRGRKNAVLAASLRLNALWYAALELTGMALHGLSPMGAGGTRDSSGEHFERLTGRFRRAFGKAFWCEEHERICAQELRDVPDHGGVPDAEQLLLLILPTNPLPRTKQLGVLAQIEARGLGPLGVWVLDKHQQLVESLLHRAWLAQALGRHAHSESQRHRAQNAVRPLVALRETALTTGLHAFYREGKPLGHAADPIVTAEVLGTLDQFHHS